MNWYDDESELSNLSVSELDNLVAEVVNQRNKLETLQRQMKEENEILRKMQGKALALLKDIKRDSYKSPAGTLGITRRTSVKMPRDPEARERFFSHLKEQNLYDNMITINSQTLNAWYKQEFDQATLEKRVSEFSVPGLEPPVITEIVRVTKGK